jgi:hypothetical protein
LARTPRRERPEVRLALIKYGGPVGAVRGGMQFAQRVPSDGLDRDAARWNVAIAHNVSTLGPGHVDVRMARLTGDVRMLAPRDELDARFGMRHLVLVALRGHLEAFVAEASTLSTITYCRRILRERDPEGPFWDRQTDCRARDHSMMFADRAQPFGSGKPNYRAIRCTIRTSSPPADAGLVRPPLVDFDVEPARHLGGCGRRRIVLGLVDESFSRCGHTVRFGPQLVRKKSARLP